MNDYNTIEKTFIACRTTADFKGTLEDYARQKDLSISQIVRRGIRLMMESEPVATPAWSENQ